MMRTFTWMDSLAPTLSKVLFWMHPQELRLEGERHVGDLVQEKGTAVRQLESAPPVRHGVRESALDVAEKLAFQQRFGYGRAVHADERPAAARAGQVDLLGKKLLADTAFTEEQDGGIGLRGLAGDIRACP